MNVQQRTLYPNTKLVGYFFFTDKRVWSACPDVKVKYVSPKLYSIEVHNTEEYANRVLKVISQGVQKIIPVMLSYDFEPESLTVLNQWAQQPEVTSNVDVLAYMVVTAHNEAAAKGEWFRTAGLYTYWQSVFANTLPLRETDKTPVSLAVKAFA